MELSVKERRAIWATVKAARDSEMDEEMGQRKKKCGRFRECASTG